MLMSNPLRIFLAVVLRKIFLLNIRVMVAGESSDLLASSLRLMKLSKV
jgi:hypothetical protein